MLVTEGNFVIWLLADLLRAMGRDNEADAMETSTQPPTQH
jgi:hypothetical protein